MEIPDGFRSEEEFNFPNIVTVCVLRGFCTAKCIHCPVGRADIPERLEKFGNKSMEPGLFKKIIDEMSRFKHSTLRVHSVGEPTLWKELPEALKYAKQKAIAVWIFTNAITKNRELLKNLADNCAIIEVSANSFDKKNYLKTKRVDSFELVRENIEYLSGAIKKSNAKNLLLVSRVESRDKEYDRKFIEFWKKTGLVSYSLIRNYLNYTDIIADVNEKKARKIAPCSAHWTRFDIDCDGKAIICFHELLRGRKPSEILVLGDVNKTSIKKI